MNQEIWQYRNNHKRFIYEDYQVVYQQDTIIFSFSYRIDPNITFFPKIEFHGVDLERFQKIPEEILNNLAFNIGLAEIPSYWKATCSSPITINAGKLDEYQIEWWKNLILNGMGEFFFINNIDFTANDFINIISSPTNKKHTLLASSSVSSREKMLIPIGGGKDSIVTLEILKRNRANQQIGCFVLNPIPASKDIIRQSKCENEVLVTRTMDPNLLKLNSEGYLNGHTPFSALLAFISVACSVIYDYEYVILSNERSSNEGNTIFLDRKINHQFSKSIEFENNFRDYTSKYLHKDLKFFSFLRPLFEIQIARYFSKLNEYHKLFLSCNKGQKENKWCNSCPKCLSTYLMISPFLKKSDLINIFSEDLFENSSLKNLAIQLISKENEKPFECVGTFEESIVAFFLNIQNHSGENSLPALLDIVNKEVISKEDISENRIKSLLSSWSYENNLPPEFEKYLRNALEL